MNWFLTSLLILPAMAQITNPPIVLNPPIPSAAPPALGQPGIPGPPITTLPPLTAPPLLVVTREPGEKLVLVTAPPVWPDLKLSDVLHARALIRWLINNRTENGVTTFNAGFLRLAFHDCIGGCDGCINLRNPANDGLNFYKRPLDLMYLDRIYPIMSRADFYALAGTVAAEYAAELTPCQGTGCIPPIKYQWGRKDCLNENNIFRQFPTPEGDGRQFLREMFRMNLEEIVAIMGAHTIGRPHTVGDDDPSWDGTENLFDNRFYKDMLDSSLNWTQGFKNGTLKTAFSHGDGKHIMLIDDFWLAYDMSDPSVCNPNPGLKCAKTQTHTAVQAFANDNKLWLQKFGEAFTIMISAGFLGNLKDPIKDTTDTVYKGELFPPKVRTTVQTASQPSDQTSAPSATAQATAIVPAVPNTTAPTTKVPNTTAPTTKVPNTTAPTTKVPNTTAPTTKVPNTTLAPTAAAPKPTVTTAQTSKPATTTTQAPKPTPTVVKATTTTAQPANKPPSTIETIRIISSSSIVLAPPPADKIVRQKESFQALLKKMMSSMENRKNT